MLDRLDRRLTFWWNNTSRVCVCVSSVAPDQIDQETLMDSLQASLAKMHVILHIPVL